MTAINVVLGRIEMAWLRSQSELEYHPKLLRLLSLTGWEKFTAIGRLHQFWWWVQKYAETGSLAPFTTQEIDTALGFPPGTSFIQLLVKSGFVDSKPYLRVHDWWDHNGGWLTAKYKRSPEKYEDVKTAYQDRKKSNRYIPSTVTDQYQVCNPKEERERSTPISPQSGDLAAPEDPEKADPEIPLERKLTLRDRGENPRTLGTNPRTLRQKAIRHGLELEAKRRRLEDQNYHPDMSEDEMRRIREENMGNGNGS